MGGKFLTFAYPTEAYRYTRELLPTSADISSNSKVSRIERFVLQRKIVD